jgi:hypothetical protein
MAPFWIDSGLLGPQSGAQSEEDHAHHRKRIVPGGLPIPSFDLKKRILRTERIIYGDPTRMDGDPANLGTRSSAEGNAKLIAVSMGMPSEPGPSPTALSEIKIEEPCIFIPGEQTGCPPG